MFRECEQNELLKPDEVYTTIAHEDDKSLFMVTSVIGQDDRFIMVETNEVITKFTAIIKGTISAIQLIEILVGEGCDAAVLLAMNNDRMRVASIAKINAVAMRCRIPEFVIKAVASEVQ